MAYPQIGISFGSIQNLKGLGLEFKDTFSDSSIFWAWRTYLGITPANKTIAEEEGRLKIAIASGIQGRWDSSYNEAPRIFISPTALPCEIITKLVEFTENNNVQAGLFIAKAPLSIGANNPLAIVRRKSTEATPIDGVAVTWDGISVLAYANGITTLPIWFRIRIANATYYAMKAIFDYSVDGVNWTTLWTENATTVFNSYSVAAGLNAQNNVYLAGASAVYASFDFFRMLPKTVK